MCQMVHLFDIQTGADTWSNIGSKPIYCFSKPIYCFNKMMLHFQLFWNKGHCPLKSQVSATVYKITVNHVNFLIFVHIFWAP